MSEHLSFDRAKGFVALPVEVLEIDMSPGAFRLLVELCRMANKDGFCWPSLDQLSDRMGRSKSAISGYVKELRNADLVDTQTQKTANGYNYRLKYRVTFWQDWRASLTGITTSKSERSVQPTERLEESKKQNHIKHTPPLADVGLDQILKEWATCFKGAPFPSANITPSKTLIASTHRTLASSPLNEIISADIILELNRFWADASIIISPDLLNNQTAQISALGLFPEEIKPLIASLKKTWKHHWRRPPTPDQFTKLIKSVGLTTQSQRLKLLKSYQKRWNMAQTSLHSTLSSGHLSSDNRAAA